MTSKNVSEKEHIPLIEAPEEVIAGEPFEVKVSVGKIADKMEEKDVEIELYLDGELVEKRELALSEDINETVFAVTGTEEMIAAREIRNCTIHGFGVCGTCGTRSAIVNLRAVVNCKTHGLWEDSKGIEIMSAIIKPGRKCKWGPEL